MLSHEKIIELKNFATKIRIEALKAIAEVGFGHVGGTLSICEAVAVLYGGVMRVDPRNPSWIDRDYLVFSKGHTGPALYAALAIRGFFPMDDLKTLNAPGTNLPSHCDRNKTPGIDMSTGSLGQGGSCAAGIALGHKINQSNNRVYAVLGDGECDEGQVWEMALFANHHKLDNLMIFIDYNHQQIDGFTDQICDLGNLAEKFEAFGWYAQSVNGHNVEDIYDAVQKALIHKGNPSVIILNTIKGKGVSFWAANPFNHNISVTPELLEKALEELETQLISN